MDLMAEVIELDPAEVDGWNYRAEETEAIEGLRAAVRAAGGILHPIEVRQMPDGRYRAVSGNHRRIVAEMDGWPLPAFVIDGEADDTRDLLRAMAGNLSRRDATPAEDADGFGRLVEAGVSVEEIAATCGRTVGFVRARLELLELDRDVRGLIAGKSYGITWARPLFGLPAPLQRDLVRELTSREIDRPAWSRLCQREGERYRAAVAADSALFDSGALVVEEWSAELAEAESAAVEGPAPAEVIREQMVGLAELAEFLAVSRQTAHKWRQRDLLPAADATVSGAPAWWISTVRAWAEQTGRAK